eukprot:9149620-Pyramimonas_sp.AAC.1
MLFDSVPGDPAACVFEMHCLRGDATSAAVWQKQKLRCSEVESWYMSEPITSASTWDDVAGKIECRRVMGSLNICKHSNPSWTHALFMHQAAATGAPPLQDALRRGGLVLDALLDDGEMPLERPE